MAKLTISPLKHIKMVVLEYVSLLNQTFGMSFQRSTAHTKSLYDA